MKTLLGADFPKVAGIAGLVFILLGVIPGEIRLGILIFPKRDRLGRRAAIVLGAIFAAVPVLSAVFDKTVGLFNLGGASATVNSIVPEATQPTSGLLIGTAHAALRGTSYTVPQRIVVDTTAILGGSPTAIYVGDIHLRDPTVILIFKSDGPNASRINSGKDYSETEIRGALSAAETVLLKSLKQGDRQTFSYNGKAYVLKVDKVIWYLIGEDVVTVSITAQ